MSDPIEHDDTNVADVPPAIAGTPGVAGVTESSSTTTPIDGVDAVPAADATAAPAAPADDGANALLDEWRERGYITTGELFAAFPNLEPETDDLRNLYELIESKGLKILDEIAEELQLEDQRRAGGVRVEPEPDDVTARHRVTEHRPSAAHRPGIS